MAEKKPIPPANKILECYKPLWNERKDYRYFLLTGGRNSGKSFAVSQLVLSQCINIPKTQVLYTRLTLTSADISIIPEFMEKAEIYGCLRHIKPTLSEINFSNGSRIYFRGLKTGSKVQTAALKSLKNISLWVLDEAEELVDEELFDKIDQSIRSLTHINNIILILNPCHSEHWIYKRWLEKDVKFIAEDGIQLPIAKAKFLKHIHSTYLDNELFINPDYIELIKEIKKTNRNKYNHQFLGEWLNRAEGCVFTNWRIGEFNEYLPYCYGQDFGFNVDPTTLIRVGIDLAKKRLYLDELLYNTKLSTDEIAVLDSKLVKQPNDVILGDSAEGRLIAELNTKHGINIIPTQKEKIEFGIVLMQDYELFVTETSYNLQKELNNYVYLNKTARLYIDAYNHAIDAARYAFIYLIRGTGKNVF